MPGWQPAEIHFGRLALAASLLLAKRIYGASCARPGAQKSGQSASLRECGRSLVCCALIGSVCLLSDGAGSLDLDLDLDQ